MLAAVTDDGICLLEFTDRRKLPTEIEEIEKIFNAEVREGRHKYLRQVKRELKEYFSGKRKEFSVPVTMEGSEFQKSVWNELLNIPYGSTRTYQQQADLLMNSGSVRAAAHANGLNRIAIIIPCHRVIGSDGRLVGYGGGLIRKKWLLNHEKKYSGKPTDLELF